MSSRYRLLDARLKGFRQYAKVRGWRAKRRAELIVVQFDTPEIRQAVRELGKLVASMAKSYAMD